MIPDEIFQKPEQDQGTVPIKHVLHTVTPLSKYLALVLFIILPFLGGWIGYNYAPEKVVVQKVFIEMDNSEELVEVMAQDQGMKSDLGTNDEREGAVEDIDEVSALQQNNIEQATEYDEVEEVKMQTYIGGEYGLEFQYPSHWAVISLTDSILIKIKDQSLPDIPDSDLTGSTIEICPRGGCRNYVPDTISEYENKTRVINGLIFNQTIFYHDETKQSVNRVSYSYDSALGNYPDFQINFIAWGPYPERDLVEFEKVLDTLSITY